MKNVNLKLKATAVSSSIFSIAILIIAFYTKQSETEYPATFLYMLLGSIFGWIMAFLAAPYNEKEEQRFNSYAKIILTFLSGYVLSTFKVQIEKFISQLGVNELLTIRFFLAIGTFCLTLVTVYVFRAYANEADKNKPPIEKPIQ